MPIFRSVPYGSIPPPSFARSALGDAIRRAREARGLSQRDLEAQAQVDQSTISRVEAGRPAVWKLATILRLLDALEVTEIRFGSGPRPTSAPSRPAPGDSEADAFRVPMSSIDALLAIRVMHTMDITSEEGPQQTPPEARGPPPQSPS